MRGEKSVRWRNIYDPDQHFDVRDMYSMNRKACTKYVAFHKRKTAQILPSNLQVRLDPGCRVDEGMRKGSSVQDERRVRLQSPCIYTQARLDCTLLHLVYEVTEVKYTGLEDKLHRVTPRTFFDNLGKTEGAGPADMRLGTGKACSAFEKM